MAAARFLFAVRKGRPVEVFGDGEQTRDTTYVMDAVEATAVALEAAPGDVHSTWADSRRAARELGYAPRTGLEEGIAVQAEWALRESPVAGHA